MSSNVLAIGPFPPAVTGAAKNTAIVCDALEKRGTEVVRIPTNRTRTRSEHLRSPGLYAERALGFSRNFAKVASINSRRPESTTVYLVPDGGLGAAFSAVYARISSLKFPRLVVHHRNYSHINVKSRFMSNIACTDPERTLHVFLDPIMEERFKAVYSTNIKSMYVPNAATCDVSPADPEPLVHVSKPLTVGFLSILIEDKGFDVVAEAFVKAHRQFGGDMRFLLAGQPVGVTNAARLNALRQELGDALDYRGEVFGDAKTAFFKDCDIFVFPTRYDQEAQPNVLYEAMAGGSLIISTRWAGVPWVVQDTVGTLIDPGPDRAEDLVEAIHGLASLESLAGARARQTEAFRSKKLDADARYVRLIDLLSGPNEF